MPEKHDGSSLLSESDEAIFQYLDEMLSDPGEGSGAPVPEEKPAPPKPAHAQSHHPAKPLAQPKQQPAGKTLAARPLLLEAPPLAKVIASPETLLRLQQPIVVQQPAVEEKPAVVKPAVAVASKAVVKVEVKTDVKTEAPPQIEVKAKPIKAEPLQPQQTVRTQAAMPEAKIVPEMSPADAPAVPEAAAHVQPGDDRLPPMESWCDNGRPDWAEGRFECLLFEVAGLKLAVPLVTLGAVHQINRKFTPLPGQCDWFIGILQTNLGNIKVIDTALCVMPERYDPANRETLEFVITLHGFSWGISCHSLLKSITLEPEDVKWRTQRGKRPWMAGTVVEQMCALIDPAGFHHVILQAERR